MRRVLLMLAGLVLLAAPASAQTAEEIVAKIRADPAEITLLGPSSTPGAAGDAQWRWLAKGSTSPMRSCAVHVETSGGHAPTRRERSIGDACSKVVVERDSWCHGE